MRDKFCIVWIFVAILSCAFAFSKDIFAAEELHLTEAGTYLRTKAFIKLYHVKFETLEPAKVIDRFLASTGDAHDPKSICNALGEFILDPGNRFPVRLTLTILNDVKNYSKEKASLLSTLARAGIEVDENWQLKKDKSHQDDVTRYVKSVLGLIKSKPGDFYAERRKGDMLLYDVDANDHAAIEYRPAPLNKRGRPGKVEFTSSRVLRSIISTYLCIRNCSDELKGQLPQALLKKIVDEYEKKIEQSSIRK